MSKNVIKNFLIGGGFILLIVVSLLLISFIESFLFYNPSNGGMVSLTFDDGFLSQYENAFPLMQEYNLTGTLYIVVNGTRFYELERGNIMDIENVLEMYESGWEIGAHSVNHKRLDILNKEELSYELEYPIEFFKKFDIEITSVAYPFGDYNKKTIEKTKEIYSSGRTTVDKRIQNFFLGNRKYTLVGRYVGGKHSPEEVCGWIEKAERKNRWLILVFHSIEEVKSKKYDTSKKEFEEILRCINNIEIEVKNVGEAIYNLS